MKSIQVIPGAIHIIVGGPSNGDFLQSLGDRPIVSPGRKRVRFTVRRDVFPAREIETIVDFTDACPTWYLDGIVLAAIRKNPYNTHPDEWVLWVDGGGGIKYVINYSSSVRVGSAKEVKQFPKYW